MAQNFENRPMRVYSVLIVDDHPLYSEALSEIVRKSTSAKRIEVTTSMKDTAALLSRRFVPSIVFFDLNLPDVMGASGFISLKKKLADVPIVVISATTNLEVVKLVDEAGAAGYISKNMSREALELAVGQIIAGAPYFPKEYLNVKEHPSAANQDEDLQDISQKLAQLTPQQSKILQMICEGKLNKQIAYELDLAEATVKTHITALMRKLGVQNRTQAALLVRDAVSGAKLE